MTRSSIMFLLAWVLMGGPIAAGSIDDINRAFVERYDRAKLEQEARLEKLRQGYIDALERYTKKVQASGNLELVVLARSEADTVRKEVMPMPQLLEKSPYELKQLRLKYQKALADYQKSYAKSVVELAEKLDELLKQRETELTRNGEIDAAMKAKELRAGWQLDQALIEARALVQPVGLQAEDPGPWRSLLDEKSEWKKVEPKFGDLFSNYPLPEVGIKNLKRDEVIMAHAKCEQLFTLKKPATEFRCLVYLNAGGEVILRVKPSSGPSSRKKLTGKSESPVEFSCQFPSSETITLITDPDGSIDSDQAIWIRPLIR